MSISRDGSKMFEERATPDPLVDLAADPERADRLTASTPQGGLGSMDESRTWRERDRIPNIRFSWPSPVPKPARRCTGKPCPLHPSAPDPAGTGAEP